MTTAGDRGAAASAPGGLKESFVAEIVRALRDDEVDLAVHSAKDLPAEDPEGVLIAAVPERASPFDVLVTREPSLLDEATVGTSSVRRRGQLARLRPDVEVVDIRGNVDTRLRKLNEGEVDGVVLAAAGLGRLGIRPEHVRTFTAEEMVPAPGQGAIAVQTRERGRARPLVAQLDHEDSRDAFFAERRLMHELGGGCSLPLGAFATIRRNPRAFPGESFADVMDHLPRVIDLVAVVFDPDPSGGEPLTVEVTEEHPSHAGIAAAEALLEAGAAAILERLA